jgi:broad specificity phosphatase PhoE
MAPAPAATPAGAHADPLARLRERVERAAAEIERLREENARLAERVAGLAEHEVFASGEAALPKLAAGEDPEELKARIEGFIDALDRVLAARSEAPMSSPTHE